MKNNFSQSIKQSWKKIKENRKYFGLAIGFDLVFLLIYGFVTYAYQTKIFQYIQAIGVVAISAEGIRGSSSPSFGAIFLNDQTIGYFLIIILLAVLLLFSVYFLFTFLFGTSTYISFHIDEFSHKKMTKYIRRLFRITIPWVAILALHEIVALYFALYFSFIDTARGTLGMEKTYFTIFSSIFMILLVYFMLISFMLDKKKNFRNSFKLGVKKFTKLFPVYALILIIFFGLDFLSGFFNGFFNSFSVLIAIVYEALIVLGFLVFARVLFKTFSTRLKLVK